MKTWRFIGFDDSFRSFSCKKAHLVGCITAGCKVEGFVYTEIEVDGFDVTERIIDVVLKSKFFRLIKCIFLYGITFAGMNVADIVEIYEKTEIPVISVSKKAGDLTKPALKAGNAEKRMKILKKAGNPFDVFGLKVHFVGCSIDEVKEYITSSTCVGKIPECLRISHLVSSALAYGESKKA